MYFGHTQDGEKVNPSDSELSHSYYLTRARISPSPDPGRLVVARMKPSSKYVMLVL